MNFENYERLIEAASWRLGSELVRRHPNFYHVFIGAPGGGQSDVLWFSEKRKTERSKKIFLNRKGSILVYDENNPELPECYRAFWKDYLLGDSVKFLDQLEKKAGLPKVSKIPSTTPLTLTYRFLVQFLHYNLGCYKVVNGVFDTAGYGGGIVKALSAVNFDPKLLDRQADDLLGIAEYRFWIVYNIEVIKGSQSLNPVFAIEETSTQLKFFRKELEVNLYDVFTSQGRSIEKVTDHICRLTID